MELQTLDPEAGALRGRGAAHRRAGVDDAPPRAAGPRDRLRRRSRARAACPCCPESLLNGHYATTIGAEGIQIQTVEHLLAAVRGLGIDNLLIELDGPELPAMDGSSAPFVSLLYAAGRESPGRRAARRRSGSPRRSGWATSTAGSRSCRRPSFRISYTLDHEHPAVGVQVASFVPTERVFVEELAPARTYGFLKDLELLRQQGLALGGSLDNAVVVGQERVLNGALRFQDEFVRHKILDVIGDLTLVGRPVVGHVVARNAGPRAEPPAGPARS